MAQQTINTTDSPETGRGKINANFDELYSVKKYVALLTQIGTAAPVATVLENTLGGTVVWTRTNPGSYVGTLSGAFPLAKTFLLISDNIDITQPTTQRLSFLSGGDNSVQIYVYDPINESAADDLLSNTPIEIRVYP